MIPLREFTSGAEMMEFYRQLFKKRTRHMPIHEPEPEPEPEPAKPEPPPPQIVRGRVSIERILFTVRQDFNMSLAQLRQRSTTKDRVVPRQIVEVLAHQLTRMSNQAIGNVLGHLDHSTVLKNMRSFTVKMTKDEALAARVQRLRNQLLEETRNDQCDDGRARDNGSGGSDARTPRSATRWRCDESKDL